MKRIHILTAAGLLALASIGTALASPTGGQAVLARVALHQSHPAQAGYIHISLHPYDGAASPRDNA